MDSKTKNWFQNVVACCEPKKDLDETYQFIHDMNAYREIDVYIESDDVAVWKVKFLNFDGEPVLEYPLDRQLQIREGTNKVLYRNAFFIESKHRRKGFGRLLLDREEGLCKKWGVSRIELNAFDDGIVVWIKKFGFQPLEPGLLRAEFSEWKENSQDGTEIDGNYGNLPEDFLKSLPYLPLYKDLT